MPLGVVQQRKLANRVAMQDRHYNKMAAVRNDALRGTAIRAGVALTGALATGYAIKKVRAMRQKIRANKEARYRGYDVYPQHNYAAMPVQRTNSPVYYGDEEAGDAPRMVRMTESRRSHELPKQITGFQRKRRRFRYVGIRSKLHPYVKKVSKRKKSFAKWFKKREDMLQNQMMKSERSVQASPSKRLAYNKQRIGRSGVRIAAGAVAGHVAGQMLAAGSPHRYVRKHAPKVGTTLGAFAGAGLNSLRHETDHYHSLKRAVNAPKQETPIDLPAHHYMEAGKKARKSNHRLRMSLMRAESREEIISRLVESLLRV
jgi:uncharacterized protein YcfJ